MQNPSCRIAIAVAYQGTVDDLCPNCRRSFVEGGGRTDDHVIGKASGTQAAVPSCKACNDTFGATVEGEFHRESSIFRLARNHQHVSFGVTTGSPSSPNAIDAHEV